LDADVSTRPLVLTALLLALLLPATVRAAPPSMVHVLSFPSTDGRSAAAWADGDAVRVLTDDQPLGGETLLPVPDGCRLGALNATDVVYECAGADTELRRVRLQDRSTGAARDSPVAFQPFGAHGQLYALSDAGRALAVIHNSDAPHVDAGQNYRRLSDGRDVALPVASRHRALTLDTASGTVRLCAPLTLGTHRVTYADDFDGRRVTYDAIDQHAYRPPYLLTVHRGRALLKRCGARRVRDLGPVPDTSADPTLVLTARYAAWATASDTPLRIHRLADHHTFTYTLATLARAYSPVAPRLAATDHRLWLIAADGTDPLLIQP
jgi:hypothetical protein